MRKALVTALVIAGSFVGCGGTPGPVAATHTVAGEASPAQAAPSVASKGLHASGGVGDVSGGDGGPRPCTGASCDGHITRDHT
jgi:hypothetical protein